MVGRGGVQNTGLGTTGFLSYAVVQRMTRYAHPVMMAWLTPLRQSSCSSS